MGAWLSFLWGGSGSSKDEETDCSSSDGIPAGNQTKQERGKNSKNSLGARRILLSLPGATHTSFLSSFYSAREVTSEEKVYLDILEYVRNGQAHKGFEVKVDKIIRIVRDGAIEFEHDSQLKKRFRMMLWHGTNLTKIAPILENGFQLPQPKGQMFGPGIYFADRISKSCNYCDDTCPGSKAYLLLCDVLLGSMYNAKEAHSEFTEAPSGFKKEFDSVKCTGRNIPNQDENRFLNGSVIPCGKTVKNEKFTDYALQYNEFIVYDTSKIRIKFLVRVEFS